MTIEDGYLPLGFWLEAKYPCYTDVRSKAPGTIALVNPEPFDYQIYYPIPVTFYQDIQQEEFWDVGVRAFGHKILHYRTFSEGCLVRYNVSRSGRSRYKCLIDNAIRVKGQRPFEGVSEDFCDKISELETMISMTPRERAARNLGQVFLRSSMEDDAFWNDTTAQHISVEKIFKIMACTPKDNREADMLIVSIARLLSKAAEVAHHGMIVAVLASEDINATCYSNKRKRLLKWNRGTREFTRSLQNHLIQAPRAINMHMPSLDRILIALERSRMMLWSPSSELQDVADYEEFTKIQNARNNPQMSRDICYQMQADHGCSIFARCCSEIMLCGLDSADAARWTERHDVLERHIETLSKFRSQSRPGWLPALAEWAKLALDTKQMLIQLHGNAGQQGGVEQTLCE